MRLMTLLFSLLIISPFALGSEQGEEEKSQNEEDKVVGKIEYELIDNEDKSVISKVVLTVHKSDIEVVKRGANHFDRSVKLHENLHFGIASFREQRQGFSGFGLWLRNRSVRSFSWDWFTIVGKNKAKKLQGRGDLDFSFFPTAGLVEIDKISFTSDATLRCRKMNLGLLSTLKDLFTLITRRAPKEDWLCKIKKGSYIYWISDNANEPLQSTDSSGG